MINHKTNRVFITLFLLIVIDTMGLGIVFPVLSPLIIDSQSALLPASTALHARELYYGAIIAIFSVFLLIGAPLLGDLSDRIGRKKTLLLCLSGTAISFLLCALGIIYHSLFLLFIGRALDGFTAGSNAIAQAAITDISAKANKARNLAYISLANCIGLILGPIMGGYFSEHSQWLGWGYATPFLLAMLLTVFNIIGLFVFFFDGFQSKRNTVMQWGQGFSIFIQAFRCPNLRTISILFLGLQLSWSIYFQFISIVLVHQYHYTASHIGLFMTFLGILFTLSLAFIIKPMLERLQQSQLVSFAFAIITLSLIFATQVHHQWLQWLCVIPLSIGVAMGYTCCLNLFSDAVDKTLQGWVMGVSTAVAAGAWMLGASTAGILAGYSIKLPFIAAASVACLTFIYSLGIRLQTIQAKVKEANG